MKLSEIKNEEAMEVLADILEPVTSIFADEEIRDGYRSGKPVMELIRLALKGHSKECVAILAATEQTPVEKYECNVLTIPKKLLDIVNDPVFTDFFHSAAGTDSETVSGAVTENTEAVETDSSATLSQEQGKNKKN